MIAYCKIVLWCFSTFSAHNNLKKHYTSAPLVKKMCKGKDSDREAERLPPGKAWSQQKAVSIVHTNGLKIKHWFNKSLTRSSVAYVLHKR